MNKCIFLDRDGVINKDYVDYVYTPEKWELLPGLKEALTSLKKAGYKLVIVTNQSGIAKGIYTREQMHECHQLMQKQLDFAIDHIYYAPWHESVTNSLTRKPGSLMFEKAMAKFNVDPKLSWMIGDKDRDLIPAKKLGIKTIQVDHSDSKNADYKAANLPDALEIIFG
ncbi:D-glycero-alpha-D-manno-heptose-1,7-bisphosphate 7-phosphatase [Fulvivirga ligni]|uniref:D-glycero-alpha-D-manno-heptose-1,7-bisphosphate 7-phosphatase n=1 Tax=Fulvivirga ligni TaxID=2904246 RepID=UPI001F398FFD|nr:HAD family hydrolase [Fulvivirga ligni]UII23637.1 HAD family hydrolase [Fulvivirga ligni]